MPVQISSALPGTARSVHVKGWDPQEGRVSIIYGGISLPVFFSRYHFGGSICTEGVFFGDGTLSSPREFFVFIPLFSSAVRSFWFKPSRFEPFFSCLFLFAWIFTMTLVFRFRSTWYVILAR